MVNSKYQKKNEKKRNSYIITCHKKKQKLKGEALQQTAAMVRAMPNL